MRIEVTSALASSPLAGASDGQSARRDMPAQPENPITPRTIRASNDDRLTAFPPASALVVSAIRGDRIAPDSRSYKFPSAGRSPASGPFIPEPEDRVARFLFSVIQDKAHLRTVAAREAMKEGYTPCTRCLKKYLRAELGSPKVHP